MCGGVGGRGLTAWVSGPDMHPPNSVVSRCTRVACQPQVQQVACRFDEDTVFVVVFVAGVVLQVLKTQTSTTNANTHPFTEWANRLLIADSRSGGGGRSGGGCPGIHIHHTTLVELAQHGPPM